MEGLRGKGRKAQSLNWRGPDQTLGGHAGLGADASGFAPRFPHPCGYQPELLWVHEGDRERGLVSCDGSEDHLPRPAQTQGGHRAVALVS